MRYYLNILIPYLTYLSDEQFIGKHNSLMQEALGISYLSNVSGRCLVVVF